MDRSRSCSIHESRARSVGRGLAILAGATSQVQVWEVGAHAPAFCEGRETGFHADREQMMQVYERERELRREIAGRLALSLPDVDVLAVELLGADRFCVYIDHPDGVDHALCERVTEALRGYLDRYTVDVSSPGFERPLRTREHFAAAAGRGVAVRTAHEIGGRRRFRGQVAEAGAEALALTVGAGRVEIPYAEIVRGNLIDQGREL
jgi:ribosome maturation factor RimP